MFYFVNTVSEQSFLSFSKVQTNVPNVHKRSHRISGQTLLLFNHWERTKLFVYKCTKYNNKQNNSIRFNHITFVSCLIYNFLLYTCRVQGLISWLMTIAAVGFCLMKIRGFQRQLNFFMSRTGCGIQRRQKKSTVVISAYFKILDFFLSHSDKLKNIK